MLYEEEAEAKEQEAEEAKEEAKVEVKEQEAEEAKEEAN